MAGDPLLDLSFLSAPVEFRSESPKTQLMPDTRLTLQSECKATIIPAGDEVVLPAGAEIELVQNLGGSLTVQRQGILYRIDQSEMHHIDPDQLQPLVQGSSTETSRTSGDFSEELLWDALKTCFDPEIPINIVDLGLIYDLTCKKAESGKQDVSVKMTLTAQGCGMGPVIAQDAQRKLEAIDAVESAVVEIVWDPPWTPHMISPEGRMKLGIT